MLLYISSNYLKLHVALFYPFTWEIINKSIFSFLSVSSWGVSVHIQPLQKYYLETPINPKKGMGIWKGPVKKTWQDSPFFSHAAMN